MFVSLPFTDDEKFNNWFVRPLNILLLLKDGDAAFIGFGVSLALYERLIRARMKKLNIKGNPENFRAEVGADLSIDPDDFGIWWEMFRDGIQHQASPKKVRKGGVEYGWHFSHTYQPIPQKDGTVFKVDPWGFVDLVLKKYQTETDALAVSDTFALGDIGFEIESDVAGAADRKKDG